MTRKTFLLAVGILLVAGSFWPGMEISFKTQCVLYESLRTTAGIIFTVMGIWVALLYPGARDAVMKLGTAETEEEKRLQELLWPMIIATGVLAVVLFFGLVGEAVRPVLIVQQYVRELRGCSFALLCGLTLALFWSVLLTLIPMVYVTEDLQKIRDRKDAVRRLRQVG